MSRVPIVNMMQRPERKSMNDAKKMGAHEVIGEKLELLS